MTLASEALESGAAESIQRIFSLSALAALESPPRDTGHQGREVARMIIRQEKLFSLSAVAAAPSGLSPEEYVNLFATALELEPLTQ